jgi:hypothetical protein
MPSVAGELGGCTGSVGPVPAVDAAKATEDSSVANVNAVSLEVIMVSPPFLECLPDLGLHWIWVGAWGATNGAFEGGFVSRSNSSIDM